MTMTRKTDVLNILKEQNVSESHNKFKNKLMLLNIEKQSVVSTIALALSSATTQADLCNKRRKQGAGR